MSWAPLPTDELDLVHSSMAALLPQQAAAAERFYARLFELDPSVRPLFTHDMTVQGRKFMDTLAHMVHGLYRLERIRPTIEQLGREHVGFGVRPEHYPTVRTALLWALAETLGGAFTPEVHKAWEDAYDLIAAIMVAAAKGSEQA